MAASVAKVMNRKDCDGHFGSKRLFHFPASSFTTSREKSSKIPRHFVFCEVSVLNFKASSLMLNNKIHSEVFWCHLDTFIEWLVSGDICLLAGVIQKSRNNENFCFQNINLSLPLQNCLIWPDDSSKSWMKTSRPIFMTVSGSHS